MNPQFFRKALVALTGLFLSVFLLVHLSANMLLLLPIDSARPLYNAYSTLLRESTSISIVSYFLYASIIIHVIYALLITAKNRKAKIQSYVSNLDKENSSWASKNMGFLGMLILIFIVIHLANFWARIKLGLGDAVLQDAEGYKDVYEVTYQLFQNPYYALFYTAISIPLAYHLHHGLKSSFKTLGFYHKRGLRVLAKISLIYALIMGIGFGIIPLVVYFK